MSSKQIFDGRFTRLFADEVYIDGNKAGSCRNDGKLTFALSSNSNMELIETLQTGVNSAPYTIDMAKLFCQHSRC